MGSKDALPEILSERAFIGLVGQDPLVVEEDGSRFTVTSFLDDRLQAYVQRLLERSRTLHSAVVVLNPIDGHVLAVAGHGENGTGEMLFARADFPAASLFKVISAAAALERAGFTPDRKVHFVGRKHTLYRKQLAQKGGRYTSETTFRRAFASSINPVFGKLGIYDLGQDALKEYAERFLFDRAIPFDIPVEHSTIEVPADDFGLAEIASGFNKKTRISPLHAALLVSAVANRGIMMAPRLVAEVREEPGKTVFTSRPSVLAIPVSRGTADGLKVLMRDTVRYGTCRRAFQPLMRRKRFQEMDVGAKTGTINDETDTVKYDWLTAFALSGDGTEAICVAVMGIHGKRLGVRAGDLGRLIIDHYFSS
jgi:cell division protein FtsI/penicillin-binding protein 2